jgi:hypothetical protein
MVGMASSMPTPPPTQQPARKDRTLCLYTREERAIFSKYKVAYKATTTPTQRIALLRNEVLPVIHNYWYSKEGVMPTDAEIETRNQVSPASVIGPGLNKTWIKNLFQWVRNNWRPKKHGGADRTKRKMSRILMVWRDRKEEVEEEMQVLYDEEGGMGKMDNKTKLRLWPTAASLVYRRLGDDQKADIARAIEKLAAEGNPPDIQRKRATKHGAARVRQWAAEQFRDMGMVAIAFFAYRDKQNRLMIGL